MQHQRSAFSPGRPCGQARLHTKSTLIHDPLHDLAGLRVQCRKPGLNFLQSLPPVRDLRAVLLNVLIKDVLLDIELPYLERLELRGIPNL